MFLKFRKGYNLPGPSTVIWIVGELDYELNFSLHWRVHRGGVVGSPDGSANSLTYSRPPFGRQGNKDDD